MDVYAQHGVSKWVFEYNDKQFDDLDYINNEHIIYDRDGNIQITLQFEVQSELLKQLIKYVGDTNLTLHRIRTVRPANNESFEIKETFHDVVLSEYEDSVYCNEIGQITLTVSSLPKINKTAV